MITEFCNGYNVTGNHGATVREYRICNAGGGIVRVEGGKRQALAVAASLPAGDVPEPKPVVDTPDPKPVADVVEEVACVPINLGRVYPPKPSPASTAKKPKTGEAK